MKRYDIVIVGAGPSGSTLARMLDKKFKVLLLDDNNSGKVCGGIISPDAQIKFAEYGLNIPKDVLVDPQIMSVKTMDLESKQVRNYYRNYINIDRYKFDKWLVSLAKDVDYKNTRCKKIEKIDDMYELTLFDGENEELVRSKIIIGADGANSMIRRKFFTRMKTREYLAIQQWFTDDRKAMYSCIFDQKTSPVCSWTISKDGKLIFGGAFEKKNSRKNFDLQKDRLKRIGIELGEPLKTEACIVLRPCSFASFCHGNNDAFLVGEAAGYISPSSMEGISYAFLTAEKLAKYLNLSIKEKNLNVLEKYIKSTRKIRVKLIAKRVKEVLMYVPCIRKIILKTGLTAL